MEHSQIIWVIIGTATFASTFGVYVAVRLIKQYTSPTRNTLRRPADIELNDYIEPTRPQQIYHVDLEPEFSLLERVQNYIPSLPPSYRLLLIKLLIDFISILI